MLRLLQSRYCLIGEDVMKTLLALIAAIIIPGGFILLAASYIGRLIEERRTRSEAAAHCP